MYLCYVLHSKTPEVSIIPEFVTDTDTNGLPVLDLNSERKFITWLDGGHNGGNLQFGPDGYL